MNSEICEGFGQVHADALWAQEAREKQEGEVQEGGAAAAKAGGN